MHLNNYQSFFIIGAPNSGSTSLWHLIRQHPEICMAKKKEPRFFTDENFSKKWDWYFDLFNCINKKTKLVGEASVNYSETHIWPETPKRIKRFYPEAKIIYIVRNPINRLESCWRQALSSGHWQEKYYSENLMSLDFNQAVLEYPHFLDTCRYWKHLNAYRKYFKDENILVLMFEDFIENQIEILEKCYRFLEVPDNYISDVDITKKNAGFNKRMVRPGFARVKSFIGGAVTKIIPKKIKNYIKNTILTKQVPQKVDWDTEVRKKVISSLEEDVKSILDYSGKNKNFWKLNDL